MRTELTEIAFILDRSGSMAPIVTDAIGGFNQFLAGQQAAPGHANFTLVLFDHEYSTPYSCVDIQTARPLDSATYVPRGTTALLDAVGRTIDAIGVRLAAMPEAERPGKVIVAIFTDGLENASIGYTEAKVAAMIRHQQEKYSWEFIFMAANQDEIASAAKIGIRAQDAMSFAPTPTGVVNAHMRLDAEIRERRARK